MTEILSTLLLQFVLLVLGFVPGLERNEASAGASSDTIEAPTSRPPAPVAPPAARCAETTDCDAARMRWQVTLASPALRRCGSCERG